MPDGTYPLLAQYVVTDDPPAPSPLVRQVDRDPVGFVATLKRQLGKGIWLCGGGDLATQLLDEIWVKVTPPSCSPATLLPPAATISACARVRINNWGVLSIWRRGYKKTPFAVWKHTARPERHGDLTAAFSIAGPVNYFPRPRRRGRSVRSDPARRNVFRRMLNLSANSYVEPPAS